RPQKAPTRLGMFRQSRTHKASAECLTKATDRRSTSDVAMAKFHSRPASNPQGKSVVVFLITWSGAICSHPPPDDTHDGSSPDPQLALAFACPSPPSSG